MSSARVQRLFEAIPDAVKKVGAYTFNIDHVIRWRGRVTSDNPSGTDPWDNLAGYDACLIDIDSATWASDNRRAILVAIPAADKNNTAAMKTQSHASGMFVDGSVWFKMFVETPGSWTGAQAAWTRHLEHHLRGQLGAPVELLFCADGTQPRIKGVDGYTGAEVTFVSAGVDLPYGMTYPGGV